MKLNLIKFIPKKIDSRNLFVEESNSSLLLYCDGIKPPKPLTLKKEIVIDNLFFEVIGLYFGDGANSISGSGNRRVAFANTSYELQLHWIKFLEKFGIEKDKLYAQIQIGRNSNLSYNKIFKYWGSRTKIKRSNFCSTISIKNCKTKEKGLLVLNFNNKIFRVIFNNIFNYSLNLLKNDLNYSPSFIRGLFAAEGYVALRKDILNHLEIPIKDNNRRKLVKELLENLNILSSDKFNRLNITGFINFRRAYDLRLMDLHPDKNEKFNFSYHNLLSSKGVPSLTKLKIINLLKKGSMDRFRISNKLGMATSNIYKTLKDLEIKGIVKCSGRSLSTNNKNLRGIWTLIKIPEDLYSLTKLDYCKNGNY